MRFVLQFDRVFALANVQEPRGLGRRCEHELVRAPARILDPIALFPDALEDQRLPERLLPIHVQRGERDSVPLGVDVAQAVDVEAQLVIEHVPKAAPDPAVGVAPAAVVRAPPLEEDGRFGQSEVGLLIDDRATHDVDGIADEA